MMQCFLFTMWQAIKDEFSPLEGFDASKLPYPKHHLPGAKLKGFPMKPYALLHSRWADRGLPVILLCHLDGCEGRCEQPSEA